jgi:mRNA interferase YafQ
MRTIRRATAFKRDFKRVSSGAHGRALDGLLGTALASLVRDVPLPDSNRDHALTGPWSGYRECHLRGDLLLIYRKPDPGTLDLARLGSHSELFG